MARFSRRVVVVAGFMIGLGIWLIPAGFMNVFEPWDGNGPAYPLVLLITGLLLGFFGPSRPAAAVIGVFLGQLAVLLWRVVTSPESSELWLVGIVVLAGYTSVATGIGAVLGSRLRRWLAPDPGVERRVADRRL